MNAQECCWRALIFNIASCWKFHRSYGDSNGENLKFVQGQTSKENVFCEEPTPKRFGIFNQSELEEHGVGESEADVQKHSGMFCFGSSYISYKTFY